MEITFKAGGDFVIVKVINRNLFFAKTINGVPMFLDLDKINFPIHGILNKFPDLQGKPNLEIKKIGIQRIKEYIKSLKNDEEAKDYVIKEIESLGCEAILLTRPGFRPELLKKVRRDAR